MKSYWNEEENYIALESLKEDIETEVCIIGAGLSGLSTAYYLSKNGVKVTILEKDKILSHTSSHTTAKVTSQHGLIYKYLIDSKGEEFAKAYYDANEEAIRNIKEIIEKENIACDFKSQKAYIYTEDADEVQKIKDEVEACKRINIDCEFVTNVDLPINIQGAIEFKNQGMFNPKKYGIELCRVILSNKGQIYEESKVIDIKKENENFLVSTDRHTVTAKYLVIASHYPILNTPGYYFLKMYQSTSYAVLMDTKTEKLFEGIYINTKDPFYSFRTVETGDKKMLLVVGSDHKTGSDTNLSDSYEKLEKQAKRMYQNAETKYSWHTEDCITLDKIPYIGAFSKFMKNAYVLTGYNKWGITSSNIGAKIISDMILDIPNEYEEIFKATRVEPIKNIKEVENMIKQTGESLIIDKFKLPEEKLADIKCGEGKIIEIEGKKIGVYRDADNNTHKVIPVCSHLGCELKWNNLAKTWDCPCHGSRFKYTGESIETPSIEGLEVIE